ncbi:MAG: Gx transporter family protein [Oscillospiraceae bacterium]|nr:Gx transporter family protein [Oscillospiraceae bacterium]
MKKNKKNNLTPAGKTALTGILAALTLALSFIERILCAFLPLPPGVRPGLSNVAVMFSCSVLGLPFALGIIIIKAGFVFLVSGAYAGMISLSGGFLSVLSIWLLLKLFSKKMSFLGISVASAVMHNFGQLIAASLIVGSALYMYLLPVLLISAIVFGSVTGILLNAVLPQILRIAPKLDKH